MNNALANLRSRLEALELERAALLREIEQLKAAAGHGRASPPIRHVAGREGRTLQVVLSRA